MSTERLLQEITEQADQLIREREELRKTIQQLQNDLASCKAELTLTLGMLRTKEEEILQKQASIEKLQAQLLQREQDINRLRLEKSELNKSLEASDRSLRETEHKLDMIQAEKENLLRQVADLQSEIMLLKAKESSSKPGRKAGGSKKGHAGSAEG